MCHSVRVFSASIEVFLKKMTLYAKDILRNDFYAYVDRTRFRTVDGTSWPLRFVAIDDRRRLGYFDSEDYTIGINKCLMYTAKERVLKDLLRHELAHYFTYIEFRGTLPDAGAHGAEFQHVCDMYRLPAGVRAATMDVRAENDAIEGELKSEEVIAKIKKLMSLAESDNENEAALATLRANELMVKHNLDVIAALGDDSRDVEYCVKLILPYKRSSPRMAAIAQILQEFFVCPVHTSEGLEVTGTRANVDNAEYIAAYLNRELDRLWKQARTNGKRKLRQKAFMTALARSYRDKMQVSRSHLPVSDQRALMIIDSEIEWAVGGLYGGALSTTSSRYQICEESSARGAAAGASLNIRRGVSTEGAVKLLR